jgi:uncharacterized protein DUF2795
MNMQRAAEIQALLEGIDLPATRDELVRYASLQDSEAAVDLERIDDREYSRIDEVGEELVRVQPRPPADVALPAPESGEVPGGDSYLDRDAEPGAVRESAPPDYPPQKQIDAAAATVKKQQRIQES